VECRFVSADLSFPKSVSSHKQAFSFELASIEELQLLGVRLEVIEFVVGLALERSDECLLDLAQLGYGGDRHLCVTENLLRCRYNSRPSIVLGITEPGCKAFAKQVP
jgi:hypothetical protein